MTTYNSKYSLWYQVKGGEKIEQPHCSQKDHPELEGKVKALPTDQVVDKVAQQYRKVPEKQILREKINLSNLIISGRDLGSPE